VSQSFACPNCNAPLDYDGGDDPVIRCGYCRSAVIVPENLLREGLSDQIAGAATFAVAGDLFQPDQLTRLKEIGDLTRQGDKVGASALYSQIFGVSLEEAQQAVDQLAQGKAITITHAVVNPGDWGGASASIAQALGQADAMLDFVQLAQSGQMDAAAQRYSQAFGVSLEDARQAVEQMVQGSPVVEVSVGSPVASSTDRTVKATAGVIGGVSCIGILVTVLILLSVLVPVLLALASSGGPLEGAWARVNPLAFARLVSSFGGEGSGPGLFDDPRGIAVDPDGSIFVANYADGRVQKFDPDGNFLFLWNIGPEKYATSITADRQGNVYMVYRGDIWKFDGASGELLEQVDDFANLQLETDGESTPEELVNQVLSFQDYWFEAVAAGVDGSLVAAVNTENVIRFDSDGNPVFSLAGAGRPLSGEPEGIEDIAVDGVGNIYLLADSSGSVYKYTPDGILQARFGSNGDEPGQFRAPLDIAVDGQGRIYVSDVKGIQVFAGDGRYLDKFDIPGAPFGIEFNDQGELWVVTNQPAALKYQIRK
jgi:DNA-binding beta-propeller fold protein YncE